MTSLTWPAAIVLVVLIMSVTALGMQHVLDQTWIERTFTGLLGLCVGIPIGHGIARYRAAVSEPPPPR